MEDELSMDDVYVDDGYSDGSGESAPVETGGYDQSTDSNNVVADDEGTGGLYDGTAQYSSQESVGDDAGGEGMPSDGVEGSSPDVYSSIAQALVEDGILNLPNIDGINNADALRSAFQYEIEQRLSPLQLRVNAALDSGMGRDEIQNYESALSEIQNYTDEAISDESDAGAELRHNLIKEACIARGMSDAQAQREADKSFKAGTDLEDAKEARNFCEDRMKQLYRDAIESKRQQQMQYAQQVQQREQALQASIINDDGRMFGQLPENTKRMVLTNLYARNVRMNDGTMLTPIEARAASDPVGFQKAMAVVFTLTDGFTNFDRLGDIKANKTIKRGIEGLERTLRSSGRGGGAYKYANNTNPKKSGGDSDWELIG